MNAPANAVKALIKASRPTFRSQHDKVAFACHAVAAINGLKLVAVGPQTDAPDLPSRSAPEVPIDGWNGNPAEYSFRYTHEPEPSTTTPATKSSPSTSCASLLLKCLPVDSGMFVTVAATSSDGSQLPPETLELEVARYAVPEGTSAEDTEAAGVSFSQYAHLPELVSKVHEAIESQLSSAAPPPSASTATPASTSQAAGQVPSRQPATADPVRSGGRGHPPGRSPLLADDDYDDMMPGGMDPMHLGGPARPGIMPFGPTGGPLGGGMHVGPSHPMFAGRVRHPHSGGGMPGWPGHPSGARWDPIAPEGLPGFNPEDYQRGHEPRQGGPPVHPDMMQPGAGRGTDWDHMFS